MRRAWRVPLFAVLLAVLLCACGESNRNGQPPVLQGTWKQKDSSGAYYQYAVITDDTIEVYWHVNKDSSEYLYWSGSFTPPADGREPYSWASQNNYERAKTSQYARREETLTFTYKGGRISYIQMQANIRIGVSMEKVED